VHGVRGRLGSLLSGAAVLSAVAVGPEAYDTYQDHRAASVAAAVAEAAEVADNAPELERAQLMATLKLYGMKDGKVNLDTVEKMKKNATSYEYGSDNLIDARKLLDPEQNISSDGLSFDLNGQSYSFVPVTAGKGKGIRILASRMVEGHLVEPALVGGVNQVEGMNEDEQLEAAYAFTRENLDRSLTSAVALRKDTRNQALAALDNKPNQ